MRAHIGSRTSLLLLAASLSALAIAGCAEDDIAEEEVPPAAIPEEEFAYAGDPVTVEGEVTEQLTSYAFWVESSEFDGPLMFIAAPGAMGDVETGAEVTLSGELHQVDFPDGLREAISEDLGIDIDTEFFDQNPVDQVLVVDEVTLAQ